MDKNVRPGRTTVNELVILNAKRGYQEDLYQETFCRVGDSGSLLIDAGGNVAGLLYGSMTGLCGPLDRLYGDYENVEAGIATDIRGILASIAAKTTERDKDGKPIGKAGRLCVI